MHNTAENTKVVQMKVGTGGVANGDLVTFTAGTVVKCGSGNKGCYRDRSRRSN